MHFKILQMKMMFLLFQFRILLAQKNIVEQ